MVVVVLVVAVLVVAVVVVVTVIVQGMLAHVLWVSSGACPPIVSARSSNPSACRSAGRDASLE
jgi:hypothetical protein